MYNNTMKKRNSLRIFKSVILALMIREFKTRFVENQFGYLWLILEPVSHILILSMIFMTFNPTGMIEGIPLPLFLMTGILPWTTFMNIMNRGMSGPDSNKGLFVYKNVKPIDTIFARTFIELIIFSITFSVLLFLGYLYGYNIYIKDFSTMFLVMILFFTLAMSLAIFFASISVRYKDIRKVIPMIIKPLYFISGIFYTASVLPEQYRDLNLYNPILNVIEIFRFSIFKELTVHYGSFAYIGLVTVSILFFALVFYKKNEKIMIMSR